ncbi:uncharacterized protein LOC105830571 [Monomorium pharaonis]|uniref:uncharacterized protein LOC105830571 n=1 Tax=Monomorium pharaonis TaxID=307658 RepID=UPI001745C720|nr:uncharacterized protein LOC105830571 [Monomorium pharaonis]
MQNKWWLCHATNFHSLMYPCFIYCRILGIFPNKLNASTFEISKSHYVLSTIVIYICCVINLSLVNNIISKTYLEEIIKNLNFFIFHIFNNLIVIITHILSRPRMRLLQTILEISVIIPQKSYQKLSRLIHIKDLLGIIFKHWHLYLFFSKILESQITYSVVLLAMIVTYFNLMVFQTNMLYINCVCVLKACFKSVNDTLTHMQKLVMNDRKSFTYHMQRNQFLPIKLKMLKKKHLAVSNAVQMLNKIFSLQLLATIAIIFFGIIFMLYMYIVNWKDGIYIRFNENFLDLLLSTVAYNIILILLLVWACETSKNQAKEIGIIIHDLLNSTNDEKIKHEVVN